MHKVRFIRTMIVEVELNPEYYPEGLTTEQMAQYDIDSMKDIGEYEAYFSDDLVSDDVRFEVIE